MPLMLPLCRNLPISSLNVFFSSLRGSVPMPRPSFLGFRCAGRGSCCCNLPAQPHAVQSHSTLGVFNNYLQPWPTQGLQPSLGSPLEALWRGWKTTPNHPKSSNTQHFRARGELFEPAPRSQAGDQGKVPTMGQHQGPRQTSAQEDALLGGWGLSVKPPGWKRGTRWGPCWHPESFG